jgi:FkbM family methyltransferase
MTFISYAQNCEDVILHRALQSISKGFYIDVGAGDPELHSVTKAFYDAGWSGINVEPLPLRFSRLVDERPRDINLGIVITDTDGSVPFFAVDGYDELSTTAPERVAAIKEMGRGMRESKVESRTLAAVCEEFAPREIHFLKVDVEGAELSVLAGGDFGRFRPWILVIEYPLAGQHDPNAKAWEELLVAADYLPVYFDGLNRFFVSTERADELIPAFEYPPVVFRDDFVRSDSQMEVVLDQIAQKVGSTSGWDEHEIVERLDQLLEDRIRFELLADSALGEVNTAGTQLEELRMTNAGQMVELDAFWQQSFERERYIAWQTIEISKRNDEIASRDKEIVRRDEHLRHLERQLRKLEQVPAELEHQLAEARAALVAESRLLGVTLDQVDEILTSTSWRVTLPLRVFGRPSHYLRELLRRR